MEYILKWREYFFTRILDDAWSPRVHWRVTVSEALDRSRVIEDGGKPKIARRRENQRGGEAMARRVGKMLEMSGQ
jgi:hypothetical protein